MVRPIRIEQDGPGVEKSEILFYILGEQFDAHIFMCFSFENRKYFRIYNNKDKILVPFRDEPGTQVQLEKR